MYIFKTNYSQILIEISMNDDLMFINFGTSILGYGGSWGGGHNHGGHGGYGNFFYCFFSLSMIMQFPRIREREFAFFGDSTFESDMN